MREWLSIKNMKIKARDLQLQQKPTSVEAASAAGRPAREQMQAERVPAYAGGCWEMVNTMAWEDARTWKVFFPLWDSKEDQFSITGTCWDFLLRD